MSDVYNAAKDFVTPEKASASTPAMNRDPNQAQADSMANSQRDPRNYQAGDGMSGALQTIHDRGQARGDLAQAGLNSYGQGAASFGNSAAQYGGKAYNIGQGGMADAYRSGQRIEGAGGQGAAIGNNYANQISKAGGYGMGEAARAQQAIGQSAGQMTGAANDLRGLEAQQGPSAAQAQLQSGLNKAQASNLAMARSGGGFGGSASRSSQALRQNAAMGQEAANQSAILKAGEDAAWRQRQAANVGTAGGLFGGAGNLSATGGQLGIGASGQALQGAGMAGQQALAGNAQNIGAMQSAGQMGLAGSQLGLAGANTGIAANQAGIQGTQAGGALTAQGFGLGFAGDQQAGQAIAQDQAAKQAYENMLTQQMGIQSGVNVANAQSSNAFTGGLISAGAGAGAMMAMSDERQKDVGPQVNMSSSLFGNPYGRRGAPGHMKGFDDGTMAPGTGDFYGTDFRGDKAMSPGYGYGELDGVKIDRSGAPLLSGSGAAQGSDPSVTAKQKAIAQSMMEGGLAKMAFSGGAGLQVPGGQIGPAYQPGGFQVMSDERQKKAPSLRGVKSHRYEYEDPSLPGAAPGEQVGPMAQDIERAIPGAVINTPQGKQVDAARTILPLLSVAGEQQEKIDRIERIVGADREEQNRGRLADNSHLPKGRATR